MDRTSHPGRLFRGYRGGRARGDRGIGRGHGSGPAKVRPTHFLALPLHNHPALRSKVASFQAALFDNHLQRNTAITSSLVEGLDSSIVIDPVRMHMTLGVMALEPDEGPAQRQIRKTVSSALALLSSLSPQISQILDGASGVKVPLEVLDVLKTEKMRSKGPSQHEDIGAGVLFLGPRESGTGEVDNEKRKLFAVCELINRSFRDAGYISDNRPLKLHCTILNSSNRKPRRWFPFSYSDIRSNKRACDLIRSSSTSSDVRNQNMTNATLSPMPVNLGSWNVNQVQLWVMGSRDNEGRYVNCGGVKLDGNRR